MTGDDETSSWQQLHGKVLLPQLDLDASTKGVLCPCLPSVPPVWLVNNVAAMYSEIGAEWRQEGQQMGCFLELLTKWGAQHQIPSAAKGEISLGWLMADQKNASQ